MADRHTCPQCGGPLDVDASGACGPCPRCRTAREAPLDRLVRRQRRVTLIAGGAVLAGAALTWLIIGLAGGSRQPDEKPPAPPIVFEDKPKTVSPLEGEAEDLFRHARNAVSMRRWSVAVEVVDRLGSEYGETGFYAANRAAIDTLRSEAAAKLAASRLAVTKVDVVPPPVQPPVEPPVRPPVRPPVEPRDRVAGPWVLLFDGDTLDGWQVVEKFSVEAQHGTGVGGAARAGKGQLVLEAGDPLTGIARTADFPKTNYQITLQAMRVTGRDAFCILGFPIGEARCAFVLGGYGGSVAALNVVDGREGVRNVTTRRMRFQNSRWYRVYVTVTDRRVQARVDQDTIIDLPTEGHTFTPTPHRKALGTFGLAAWGTTAAMRNIRVRRIEPEQAAEARWFGTVQFWDAATYARIATVKAHAGTAFAMAFSPDGARLASGGWQGDIQVWALAPLDPAPMDRGGL